VISRLRALWNNMFRRKVLDRELDEELQAYLELVSAEKMREGVSPEEAYRDARVATGGVEQVKESVRDVRAGVWLDSLVRDFRYGLRTLAKNPAFTLIAMATLALGIGANTAMFSLLDEVVLRLLPVRDPEKLVIVRETGNHYGNKRAVGIRCAAISVRADPRSGCPRQIYDSLLGQVCALCAERLSPLSAGGMDLPSVRPGLRHGWSTSENVRC
jgi:hypothetical protein